MVRLATRMATATLAPIPSPLDTSIRLVTPERIAFQYPLAGPFHRACSYGIDLVLLGVLAVAALIVSLLLALGTSASLGFFFVFMFILYQFYGAVCEAVFNGQTLGKRMLGLRVVSTAGLPITGGQAVLRNLLWAFDGVWPFAYLPAIACMMLTKRFQRLGDLAAGTMVIIERRAWGIGVTPLKDAGSAVLPLLPAKIPAGSEFSRVLADYVKRRDRFSPSRREEIAENLARPIRAKYNLAVSVPADALICALYRRRFLGD